ncbi:MAG: DUF362 domain-containing protein, partial [Bacteroidales bacterium]|nr:DUF362 domain-containing protein [Bacteroidales bacterium]
MLHKPENRHFHGRKSWFKLSFFFMGIVSTIWFLIRVIPKPSRATYPCMRAAFPLMSSFIIYLLTLSGSLIAFRKAFLNLKKSKYLIAGLLATLGVLLVYTYAIHDSNVHTVKAEVINPSDAPNSPMGIATGVMPGRVVWCRDTAATKTNFRSGTYFFSPENNNPIIYHKMMRESILKLTEKSNLNEAWESLFKYFNKKKKNQEVGYQAGEIIFVKINQGTISWTCSESSGWDFTKSSNKKNAGACQGNPYTILALLSQLIDSLGIPQENIYVGDPISHIMKQHFDLWKSYYPKVKYADKSSTSVSQWGRTKINVSNQAVLHYSDNGTVMTNAVTDKIYKEMETADYMINIANLKAHVRAGITLCAKNHFGSHSRDGAWHLHPSLVSPTDQESNPINNQYKQYRVLVDIMGSKYLGGNTMLFIVDGIYGGDYHELNPPRRWNMSPFNGDWCNSIFMSQDQVALESVCFDFLRTEYNGVNNSNINPNWGAVDDYLHQAASSTQWPSGITYDPDGSGTPIGSLGVHEHWNNAIEKKYTRNLGTGTGIELVTLENKPFDTSAYNKPNALNKVELIEKVVLWPNPAIDKIRVSFYSKTPAQSTIYIISSDGKLALDKEISHINEGNQQLEISVGSLPTGMYLCHLKITNSRFIDTKTIKFYKK